MNKSALFIFKTLKESSKSYLLVLIFLSLLSQFSEYYWVLKMGRAIEDISHGVISIQSLVLVVLFLFISIFGPNLFMFIEAKYQAWILRRTLFELSEESLDGSSNILKGYPGVQVASEIRLAAETNAGIINFILFDLLRTPCGVMISTYFVWTINPTIAILIPAWSFLFLYISVRTIKKTSEASRAVGKSIVNTNSLITDSLVNHKIFALAPFVVFEKSILNTSISDEATKYESLKTQLAVSGLKIISQRFLLIAGITVFGVLGLKDGSLTVPKLLVLLQYANLLVTSISNFAVRILDIGNKVNILTHSLDNIGAINQGRSEKNHRDFAGMESASELALIVSNPGSYVIKGESGIGKTTALEALFCMLKKGNLNGLGTNQIKNAPKVVYIPKESLIFNRSVKSNLFNLDGMNLVEKKFFPFNNSVVNRLSENACILSAGEQQRLNFVRIFGANKSYDYILLDEATASLDEFAAKHFYQVLIESNPKATIIAISHRDCESRFFTYQIEMIRVPGSEIINFVLEENRGKTKNEI